MHARILRYLDEVVRSGSIRQAAEKLNIASSAVNRQILTLEEELGTPIFHRLPRKMLLTAAGEILIAHIRQTLKEHDRVRARILDLDGMRSGKVTIATMKGLAGGLLPQVGLEFRRKFPRVNIEIRGFVVDQILIAIDEGEADLGLGYNIPQDSGLHVMEIFQTRLGAVVAPSHPLAGKPDGVRLSDCANFPIALALDSFSIRRMIVAAFRRASLPLTLAFETDSIEMMKYLARQGEVVTFLSEPDIAEDSRAGTLSFIPIRDAALNRQPLSLVHRANSVPDLAAGLFAEDLRKRLKEIFNVPT